mmetsp:Transcript_26727/g.66120  ORF Transcript_26727/g.66120 Transcript_26727/m.66120 type:complete len:462 (-) Transcript_26727:144-1529(-)
MQVPSQFPGRTPTRKTNRRRHDMVEQMPRPYVSNLHQELLPSSGSANACEQADSVPEKLHVFFRRDDTFRQVLQPKVLRMLCQHAPALLLDDLLANLFNTFRVELLLQLFRALRLVLRTPFFEQPFDFSPVVKLLLPAFLRIHLIQTVILRKFLEHGAAELLLLAFLFIPSDGLELPLILIGQRDVHPLLYRSFHLLLLFLQDALLGFLYDQFISQVLHFVLLLLPLRHISRHPLKDGVLRVLLILLLQAQRLLASHDLLCILTDLLVLGFHLSLLDLLEGLLLLDECVDVAPDGVLFLVPRLPFGHVLLENGLHHLVNKLLLLEELLVRLGFALFFLLHLPVQCTPHGSAVLRPQEVAVRLRLEAALPVRLHLRGDLRLLLELLLHQHRGLLDLRLALLVHVRRLQLLLELAQLLRLLADALHVLGLPDGLRLPLADLGGEPLVLLSQHLLAVLRRRGSL